MALFKQPPMILGRASNMEDDPKPTVVGGDLHPVALAPTMGGISSNRMSPTVLGTPSPLFHQVPQQAHPFSEGQLSRFYMSGQRPPGAASYRGLFNRMGY